LGRQSNRRSGSIGLLKRKEKKRKENKIKEKKRKEKKRKEKKRTINTVFLGKNKNNLRPLLH
jgi:hypothetical protein